MLGFGLMHATDCPSTVSRDDRKTMACASHKHYLLCFQASFFRMWLTFVVLECCLACE